MEFFSDFVATLLANHPVMFPFCRIHPSSVDLRSRHRLDLPLLEFGLRRSGCVRALQQRVLQASVREPGHHPEGRGLLPLHHHVVLLTQELQEVHQGTRGPRVAGWVLPITHRRPQTGGQDKVYIQPRGPWILWKYGVSFIVCYFNILSNDCSFLKMDV